MESELKTRPRVAVLIDADNIGPLSAGDVFRIACRLGDPILCRAYGTPQRFMGNGGWQNAQHECGIVSNDSDSTALAADLRNGRVVVKTLDSLRSVLTHRFHVPKPDVQVIVSSLFSQKVLTAQKNGIVTVLAKCPRKRSNELLVWTHIGLLSERQENEIPDRGRLYG